MLGSFQAPRKTSNFGVQTSYCILKMKEGTQRRLDVAVPLTHNLVAMPAVTVKKILRKMVVKVMRYYAALSSKPSYLT